MPDDGDLSRLERDDPPEVLEPKEYVVDVTEEPENWNRAGVPPSSGERRSIWNRVGQDW